MGYYGNNDWRDYVRHQNALAHFGIPKRSGRYPWGSGENPYHHGADGPGGRKMKKRSLNDRAVDILKKKIDDGTATRLHSKDERFGSFTGKQWDASNIVDKYYNNVESLSEADYKKLRDTAKEIKIKGERATNAESALEKHANTILENHIVNEVKRAKEKDNYDFNFLEAIQNKKILEDGHEAERLKAYEEYLRDPEDFWKNKVNKYKDA